MSNHITIELCAEDRARLDRLSAALERKACDKCVETAMAAMTAAQQPATPDPIREALAEALEQAETPAEAPQEPAGATEAETPATTQQPEEQPTAAADAPVVTVEDIRERYVALVSSGKKEAARDLIKSYNVTKISDIPADKCAEVLAKLNALEG